MIKLLALAVVLAVFAAAVSCGTQDGKLIVEPNPTPLPEEMVQAMRNWDIIPDGDVPLTLATNNVTASYTSQESFYELWTLVLTCNPDGENPMVFMHRLRGNFVDGEFLDVMPMPLILDTDGVKWQEEWIFDQTVVGTNALASRTPISLIEKLIHAEDFTAAIPYGPRNEETVGFAVGGLGWFIDGPEAFCEG